MSIYAITPRGVGKTVGARAIDDDWPLEVGETFKSNNWAPNMVLAEDSMSLREGTPDELEPMTPPPTASVRLDAGITAAIGAAEAVRNGLHAIPTGFNTANFQAFLTQAKILSDAFLAMLEAQQVQPPPP